MRINTAKQTVIFVIENDKIVETSLYNHVMKSDDGKLFIQEYYQENQGDVFNVMKKGFRSNINLIHQTFDTLECAEQYIFDRVLEFDFIHDDTRNIMYFLNYEYAFNDLAECISYNLNLDLDVAKSYLTHKAKVTEITEAREKIKQAEREAKRIEFERNKAEQIKVHSANLENRIKEVLPKIKEIATLQMFDDVSTNNFKINQCIMLVGTTYAQYLGWKTVYKKIKEMYIRDLYM